MSHRGSVRIRGFVKLIQKEGKIFGVIVGDDLRDYFFIPSCMKMPPLFHSLELKTTVEFTPRSTERGMRAWNVSVLRTTEHSHGESLQS